LARSSGGINWTSFTKPLLNAGTTLDAGQIYLRTTVNKASTDTGSLVVLGKRYESRLAHLKNTGLRYNCCSFVSVTRRLSAILMRILQLHNYYQQPGGEQAVACG
jgi:hypothetical protein